MRVSVAGYLSLDDLVCPAGTFQGVPGGGGLYAALAAARAGAETQLIAKVGSDFPESVLRALPPLGVTIDQVVRDRGASRRAVLMEPVAHVSQRLSPTHGAATWWDRTEALAPLPPSRLEADLLILTPMPPSIAARWLPVARKAEARIALDTSTAFAATEPPSVCAAAAAADIFAPSAEEIACLAPGRDPDAARAELAALSPVFLEKRGKEGARLWRDGAMIADLPSRAGEVRDATGAGDALMAAFAVAMAGGLDAEVALAAGLDMAALVVSDVGPAAFGVPLGEVESTSHAH